MNHKHTFSFNFLNYIITNLQDQIKDLDNPVITIYNEDTFEHIEILFKYKGNQTALLHTYEKDSITGCGRNDLLGFWTLTTLDNNYIKSFKSPIFYLSDVLFKNNSKILSITLDEFKKLIEHYNY